MTPEELEQKVWDLSTDVETLKKESADQKKFVQTVKRAIKSLRSSILALSTKEAKRKQHKMLIDAEKKGAEKERLKRNWPKRFVKWIGAPAMIIAFTSAFIAWGLGFVKGEEIKAIKEFFKALLNQ